jgi:hypothetical protein
LENRQQMGWDEYLPGHGLMLTKVQFDSRKWAGNTVNNIPNSMGVDLIEADGKTNTGEDHKSTDLFPAGATKYTKIADHAIEDIREVDGVIYFKYKGGVENPETAIEDVTAGSNVIAIYNILGQKQSTTQIEDLPRGTYVVVTTAGSKKIIL